MVNATDIATEEGKNLNAFAECDSGDFILTDGYFFQAFNPNANLIVDASRPTQFPGQIGWQATVLNANLNLELHVEAYCFDNPPPH